MRLAMSGFESAHNPTATDPGQLDSVGGTNPWVEPSGSGLALTDHNFGGCYSIRCTYTADAKLHFFDASNALTAVSEFYYRDYVRFSGTFAAAAIHQFQATSDIQTANRLAIATNSNAGLSIYLGATEVATSANSILSTGQWYRIDAYIKVADSGGRVVVNVDGVNRIDFTGDTAPGISAFDRVAFWGDVGGGLQTHHDDVAVNDLTGSVNNAAPSSSYIIALLPADADLAEQPPNDATYEEISSGVRVSSGVSVPAAALATESPVCLWVRCKGVGSAGSVQPYLNVGGTNYDSPAQVAPATDWKYVRYIWNTNPATGVAWTLTDVNSLEFGLKSASGTVQVSGMLLEVEGTGGSSCDLEVLEPVDPPPPDGGTNIPIPGAPGVPNVNFETVRDVVIAAEDPGGFANATFKEQLAPNVASTIAPFQDLIVYARDNTYPDVVTDTVVFRGRVEPTSRRSDADGMWAEYAAFGWIRNAIDDQPWWGRVQDLVRDRFVGYAGIPGGYIDTIQVDYGVIGATGHPLLRLIMPPGSGLAIPAGARFQFDYQLDVYAPGVQLSDLYFRWSTSQVLSGCVFEVWAYHGIGEYGTPTKIYSQAYNSTADFTVTNLTIPANTWRLIIRPIAFTLARSSIPGWGVVVKISAWPPDGACLIINGTALTGEGPLRASDILTRVLLDSCPALDATSIAQTPASIVGFVVDQPTQPKQVFDTLCLLAGGDYTYQVWDKLPGGKYETIAFYRPTTVRYITNPGPGPIAHVELDLESDVDWLYNRVIVNYEDPNGDRRTVIATGAVAELDAINLTRTLIIDAGRLKGVDGRTSAANALLIANVALADHSRPVRRGTIRILDRQIRDLTTSEDLCVEWLMLGVGQLIRITDTQTGGSAGTSMDDPDVWRIRRVECTLGRSIEATLVVGQGTNRLESLLARLQAANIS